MALLQLQYEYFCNSQRSWVAEVTNVVVVSTLETQMKFSLAPDNKSWACVRHVSVTKVDGSDKCGLGYV
jgi:hypothetical protein